MPRIPYVFPTPGESDIADNIRLRRKGNELTELDGIILNAPRLADGYNSFLKAVRTENSLPEDIRELMILRVAALNSASYEWVQHEPIARVAGLKGNQLEVIRNVSAAPASLDGQLTSVLTPLQASALVYTDFMTLQIAVPQSVFEELRDKLENTQQIFEATMTIATYNMVSRMLVALDVADKAGEGVPQPELYP